MSRRKLAEWQKEDARRLKLLFERSSKLSQEAFGAEHHIGSQGMVWQYLNGHTPLNLPAAIKFARGLRVSLAEISPTLAAELFAPAGVELGSQQELDEQLRYALHARFPDLSAEAVAEIIGYARGRAASDPPPPAEKRGPKATG